MPVSGKMIAHLSIFFRTAYEDAGLLDDIIGGLR
jgi:hypothetical protein